MSDLSNCHIRAWQYLRQGKARFLCLRFTEYSRLHALTRQWWWAPLRWAGIVMQWCVWPLVHLGELLRSGRWYHATWITRERGQHWEYVPLAAKQKRALPPLLFRGREQEVDDD